MESSFDPKSEIDYPTSFASLDDFGKALDSSIAHHDQRFFNYLCEKFAVGNNQVVFVGGEHGRQYNQHWAQTRSSKKQDEGNY